MCPIRRDRATPLSQHQRAVLSLLATGLTSGEVADVLRAPASDVRSDIRAAIRALKARSKLEAVVVALLDGLIECPPGPGSMPAQRDQAGGDVEGSPSVPPDGRPAPEAFTPV